MTTGTQKKFAHALCHQLLQRWMRKIKHASMSNSLAPPIGLGLKCFHIDSGKLSRAPQGYAKTAASELSPPPLSNKMSHTKNPRNSYRAAPDTVDAATSQQTNEVTRGQKGFTISR